MSWSEVAQSSLFQKTLQMIPEELADSGTPQNVWILKG